MAISRNYRILIFGEVFKINTTHFSWNSFNVHFAVLLTLLILQQLCCLYMLLRLTEKQDKYCVDIYWFILQFYSWLWSPAPSSQWILAAALHQHNRRFSGSVPVWLRVCPRGGDDSSVWEWWSVDPQLRKRYLQPQTDTHIYTDHTDINTHSDSYSHQWESISVIV